MADIGFASETKRGILDLDHRCRRGAVRSTTTVTGERRDPRRYFVSRARG
jgi:hypothetical protein